MNSHHLKIKEMKRATNHLPQKVKKSKLIDDDLMEKMIRSARNEFGNDAKNEFVSNAESEVDWYISELERLHNRGGKVYQIMFLTSIKDVNTNELGKQWVSDKGMFQRVYGNISGRQPPDRKPYLITAVIKPGCIDAIGSAHAFITLPVEGEINLKCSPSFFKIKRYYHHRLCSK